MELNLQTRPSRGKGMTSVIMAIFLMMFVVIFITAMSIFLLKDNTINKEIEIKSNIHTMSNALDAAKLYMETALAYSTYQACYDNLRKGGWDSIPSGKAYQGYSLWNSSGGQPDKAAFTESLGNSIKANLGLYRGTQAYTFLSDYYVNLPAYDVVVSVDDNDPGWMFVTAFGDSNLNIQKTQESGEYIRLEKDSTMQNDNEYKINCYGVYVKGSQVYEATAKAVNDALAAVNPPRIIMVNQGESLQGKVLPYQKQFNDTVRTALYTLSTTSADYSVDVYVYSADLKYVNDGPVTGAETPVKYIPEVYAKIEITNIQDSQQFPVYDGSKVVMTPMTLVFVGKFDGS